MMEKLLDQGVIFYVMFVTSSAGILSRLVLNRLYKGFCAATEDMASVANPLIRQIKLKFENCFRVNEGVANIPAFVDKYIYQYRFLGMSLKNIRRLFGHMLLLTTVSAGAGAGLSVYYGHSARETLLYAAAYAGCLFFMSVARYVWDERYYKTVMMTNLMDYLENTLVHRMKNEVDAGEGEPSGGRQSAAARRRRRRQRNAEAEIVQMKKNFEQIAAGKAEEGTEPGGEADAADRMEKFTPAADAAIIEDVIEEFLS